jgi:hypothetical protein
LLDLLFRDGQLVHWNLRLASCVRSSPAIAPENRWHFRILGWRTHSGALALEYNGKPGAAHEAPGSRQIASGGPKLGTAT